MLVAFALCATGLPAQLQPLQREANHIHINPAAVAALRTGPSTMQWHDAPIGDGQHATLNLQRFEITSTDTQFVIGHAKTPLTIQPPVLLRGSIDGNPNSNVYFAISNRGVLGLLDHGDGTGVTALGPRDGRAGLATGGLAWQSAPIGGMPPIGVPVCGLHTGDTPRAAQPLPPASNQRLLLQLAVDTDYEFAALFDHNLDAAGEYVVAMQGAIASIYQADVNTDMKLTYVRLWDTADDLYNEEDPLGPLRTHWNKNMGDIERDLVQLLTGRVNLPYGGVAWLNATCGNNAYSVAGYLLGTFVSATEPAFGNWDLTVAAHELGHNCGTSHTHAYEIDTCDVGEIRRGTIMSYCHTTTGGGANIDLRFHETCVAAMRAHLTAATCIFADCNANELDDAVEIADGSVSDNNADGIPDACQDCNDNGILDEQDIFDTTSTDVDSNGVPDECQADCNSNGLPDAWDIAEEISTDMHGDGIPDECDIDCNENMVSDYNEIQLNMDLDRNRNAILDACEDCDGDGTPDLAQLGGGLNIWVLSSENLNATAMHPLTGVPMVASSNDFLEEATHLAITPGGRVLIVDRIANRVIELDSNSGDLVGDFVPTTDTHLSEPCGLAFTQNHLLVLNGGDGTVQQYDIQSGAWNRELISSGLLMAPTAMTITSTGRLLVAEDTGRVQRFSLATGELLDTVVAAGTVTGAAGIVIHPDGMLLVSDATTNGIHAFNRQTGMHLGRWDTGGLPSGFWELLAPGTLRMGPGGHVLVASTGSNTAVQRYNRTTGLFQRSFYVLGQLSPRTTSFDIMPPSEFDCNGNMRIDACEIAEGLLPDNNGNGTPDGCECIADLNDDGLVGVDDILGLIAAWGTPDADLTGDGTTGVDDVLIVLDGWGNCVG